MKTWRQIISKELPTRSNVFSMITTLKKCEQFYKVKKTGVCEIRSALYNLFFGMTKLYILSIEFQF